MGMFDNLLKSMSATQTRKQQKIESKMKVIYDRKYTNSGIHHKLANKAQNGVLGLKEPTMYGMDLMIRFYRKRFDKSQVYNGKRYSIRVM